MNEFIVNHISELVLGLAAVIGPIITTKIERKKSSAEIEQIKAESDGAHIKNLQDSVNLYKQMVDDTSQRILNMQDEQKERDQKIDEQTTLINELKNDNANLSRKLDALNAKIDEMSQYVCIKTNCKSRKSSCK